MGHHPSSLRIFRWVMVAGSLAIAAVLLARGNDVLGLLIGALAIVRVVYLLLLVRRRRAFRPSHSAGPVREVLRGLVRSEFKVAAGIIGLDPAQVRRAFDEGRSLGELARSAGVPVERVVDAVVIDASGKIDEGVAEGRVTRERALQAKARLPMWANRLVNLHKGDARRAQGWT
jgi:hypothetical protein